MFWLLLFFFWRIEAVTVTWSHPKDPPTTPKQIFAAIERHVLALEAAQYASRIVGVPVKLCPDAGFDPLITEFTIPRMIGYLQFYDHDCIIGTEPGLKWWGSSPESPNKEPEKPKKKRRFVGEGLNFLDFLRKLRSEEPLKEESEEVWVLDSDSLRHWFKGQLLYSLTDEALLTRSYAHLLLKQLNVMNGPDGEKDLKRMPQAVQGASVIVLPSYEENGNLFDPTWFKAGHIPTQSEILLQLSQHIKANAGQLTIIVHEPAKEVDELVQSLQLRFGSDKVISAAKVLPKSATPLMLLKFIQKAARVLVDERDLLGRLVLLSRGADVGVARFNYGRTLAQKAVLLSCLLAVVVGIVYLTFWIQNNYPAPLKEHLIRFAVTGVLVAFPIVLLNPFLWPRSFVYFWFGVFDSNFEGLFYGLVAMYSLAALITAVVVVLEKRKPIEPEIDEESIRLTPG